MQEEPTAKLFLLKVVPIWKKKQRDQRDNVISIGTYVVFPVEVRYFIWNAQLLQKVWGTPSVLHWLPLTGVLESIPEMIQGKAQIHTLINWGNEHTMHVFGLWEETRYPDRTCSPHRNLALCGAPTLSSKTVYQKPKRLMRWRDCADVVIFGQSHSETGEHYWSAHVNVSKKTLKLISANVKLLV